MSSFSSPPGRSDGSRLVLGLETPLLPPSGVLLGLDDFGASVAEGELRGLGGEVLQGVKLAALNGRGELLVVRGASCLRVPGPRR